MSTRSTTHFLHGDEKHPYAIVYRHSDGYPEGAGVDLLRFIEECHKLKDSRLGDPSYLAARYVVFLAREFNQTYQSKPDGGFAYVRNESPLDFLSVGVVMQDPGDIVYRYVVNCGSLVAGRPVVKKCYEVSGTWDQAKRKDFPPSQWKLTIRASPVRTSGVTSSLTRCASTWPRV